MGNKESGRRKRDLGAELLVGEVRWAKPPKGRSMLRIFCCQTMSNFVYLAELHEPLAKRENNLVSAAESLSSSHIGKIFGGGGKLGA